MPFKTRRFIQKGKGGKRISFGTFVGIGVTAVLLTILGHDAMFPESRFKTLGRGRILPGDSLHGRSASTVSEKEDLFGSGVTLMAHDKKHEEIKRENAKFSEEDKELMGGATGNGANSEIEPLEVSMKEESDHGLGGEGLAEGGIVAAEEDYGRKGSENSESSEHSEHSEALTGGGAFDMEREDVISLNKDNEEGESTHFPKNPFFNGTAANLAVGKVLDLMGRDESSHLENSLEGEVSGGSKTEDTDEEETGNGVAENNNIESTKIENLADNEIIKGMDPLKDKNPPSTNLVVVQKTGEEKLKLDGSDLLNGVEEEETEGELLFLKKAPGGEGLGRVEKKEEAESTSVVEEPVKKADAEEGKEDGGTEEEEDIESRNSVAEKLVKEGEEDEEEEVEGNTSLDSASSSSALGGLKTEKAKILEEEEEDEDGKEEPEKKRVETFAKLNQAMKTSDITHAREEEDEDEKIAAEVDETKLGIAVTKDEAEEHPSIQKEVKVNKVEEDGEEKEKATVSVLKVTKEEEEDDDDDDEEEETLKKEEEEKAKGKEGDPAENLPLAKKGARKEEDEGKEDVGEEEGKTENVSGKVGGGENAEEEEEEEEPSRLSFLEKANKKDLEASVERKEVPVETLPELEPLETRMAKQGEEENEEAKEKPKEQVKGELTEEPREESKEEEIKEEPKEESKEEPKEESKEEPREELKEDPKEELKEESKEEPKEESKEEPKEESKEDPKEEPKEESKEEPKEESKEEPKEESKEEPKEESKEEPKEESKEEPKEESKEESKEEPKEESKEEPKEELKEEPKEELKDVGNDLALLAGAEGGEKEVSGIQEQGSSSSSSSTLTSVEIVKDLGKVDLMSESDLLGDPAEASGTLVDMKVHKRKKKKKSKRKKKAAGAEEELLEGKGPAKKKKKHKKKLAVCQPDFVSVARGLVEPPFPPKFAQFPLRYVKRESVPPNGDASWRPRFAGHQSPGEREASFRLDSEERVHCGFVRGSVPGNGSLTGFEVEREDREFLNGCVLVVASAIFGDWDHIRTPLKTKMSRWTKKRVCFVMFLDPATLEALPKEGIMPDGDNKVGLWKLIVIRNLPYDDPRKTGKVPKLLAHRLFPNAKYSLWVDSKLRLQVDPIFVWEKYLWRDGLEFAISQHYDRSCVWEEVDRNKELNKYNHTVIDEQFDFYKKDGLKPFDKDDPDKLLPSNVPEGSVIVRAHSPMANLFSCLWFNEVDRFTSRDQISFFYTYQKLVKSNMNHKFYLNMFPDCERRALVKLFRHKSEEAPEFVETRKPDEIERDRLQSEEEILRIASEAGNWLG